MVVTRINEAMCMYDNYKNYHNHHCHYSVHAPKCLTCNPQVVCIPVTLSLTPQQRPWEARLLIVTATGFIRYDKAWKTKKAAERKGRPVLATTAPWAGMSPASQRVTLRAYYYQFLRFSSIYPFLPQKTQSTLNAYTAPFPKLSRSNKLISPLHQHAFTT